MEALFCTPNVTGLPIEMYLHLADYMIAYDVKSADVERVGSHMQLIKTKLRTTLADQTFKSLVFLSFNLPHLHEIDVDALVEAWKSAGHRLPINSNEADSAVLSRMRSADSFTFFLKKGNGFRPPDYEFLQDRAFQEVDSGASPSDSSSNGASEDEEI